MAEERRGTPVQKWDEVNGAGSMGLDAPVKDGEARSQGERFKELRQMTGMNRKDFADYLGVPYRTMTEWERDTRTMPNYVFALIEYKIRNEFGGNPKLDIKDPNALGNVMRGVEDQLEQNDNQLDGIVNNMPTPLVQTSDPIAACREASEATDRDSVLKKLQDQREHRPKPDRSRLPVRCIEARCLE